MQTPKFLPWAARKAGISDAEAAALWQHATAEAEYFTGERDGADFCNLAIECFLELLDGQPGYITADVSAGNVDAGWLAQHQTRMSEHVLHAGESLFRSWLASWQSFGKHREAAF